MDHSHTRQSNLITIRDEEDDMGPERRRPTEWTVEAVRGLGLTTTVGTAASILGISRTKAYALAKEGAFPVTLVRVGRRYLVPTTPLLDLLTGQGRDQARPTP